MSLLESDQIEEVMRRVLETAKPDRWALAKRREVRRLVALSCMGGYILGAITVAALFGAHVL